MNPLHSLHKRGNCSIRPKCEQIQYSVKGNIVLHSCTTLWKKSDVGLSHPQTFALTFNLFSFSIYQLSVAFHYIFVVCTTIQILHFHYIIIYSIKTFLKRRNLNNESNPTITELDQLLRSKVTLVTDKWPIVSRYVTSSVEKSDLKE